MINRFSYLKILLLSCKSCTRLENSAPVFCYWPSSYINKSGCICHKIVNWGVDAVFSSHSTCLKMSLKY